MEQSLLRSGLRSSAVLFLFFLTARGQQPSAPDQSLPPATGVGSAVQIAMTQLKPFKTIQLGADPDWMVVTRNAVWVTTAANNRVTQIDVKTNRAAATVAVSKPCSGLAAGFRSLWIPSCGDHTLVRADVKTGRIQSTFPVGPATSEGGITVGAGSVWIVTSSSGILSRIDPGTNTVIASITIPSGSFCPLFADGFVWVTSTDHSVLSKVDPSTNKVVAEIPVGKNPRFLTSGAGSIWTLNQGDGTISRVDMKTDHLITSIPAGISGEGGEITFGFGSVWATIEKFPITRIDARSNSIVHQWNGDGGDSIRAGHGSIWLTNLKAGIVWRLSPSTL
jgi:virginiamycin B lyase